MPQLYKKEWEVMDKPFNNGFICEKHGIGYISECPTCASLKRPPKQNKKQAKMMRELTRKANRK